MRTGALLLAALCFGVGQSALAGAGADGRFEARSSRHFRLLQDVAIDHYTGPSGTRAFERQLLEVLEHAYRELGNSLELRPRSKVVVTVWDPQVFDSRLGPRFRFRVAGFFDGTIHVRGGTLVDARMVRTLEHEYVHAALDQLAPGVFPGWLNEGIAELFEARAVGKRALSPPERAHLAAAAREGRWIPLSSLVAPSFAHLSGAAVELAYLESYALLEYLVQRDDMERLRDLCRRVARTRDPELALVRVYRANLGELEAELLGQLR